MDTKVSSALTQLRQLGLLSCTGDDARAFLHAQLTSDIASLGERQARRAGWCSAKGRLLATMLVVPHEGGFLLPLAADLVPGVLKRLSMFVLRAKVKIADAGDTWSQFGVWGAGAAARVASLGVEVPRDELGVASSGGRIVVKLAAQRFLILLPAAQRGALSDLADVEGASWTLEEIRDGQPQVVLATQDQFVPQMVNLERLGALDFQKGCYPGQEIVARTQYRGVLKRRMVRARVAQPAAPGDDVYADDLPGQASGAVVNAAPAPEGGSELLAVVQISALEDGKPIRLRSADGPTLELLALPCA